MIKKYTQFLKESNEPIDLPELNSWDDLTDILKSGKTHTYNGRSLTEKEKNLFDEYCKRFEKGFLLTHEQIDEVLLDLDLVDDLKFKINDVLIGENNNTTDFNFRSEIKDDIRGILNLKRWYDKFIGKQMTPFSIINIEKVPKARFDNEKVYEYLEMVKDTFEDMCKCEVILDKGGPFSIQVKIKYPKLKIE